jgi:hypothetical protein
MEEFPESHILLNYLANTYFLVVDREGYGAVQTEYRSVSRLLTG